MFREKFRGMVEYKQRESRDHLDSLLAVLDELGKPASSNEIAEQMRKKTVQRTKDNAKHKYESGEINSNAIEGVECENTKNVSVRTIQRMLAYCVSQGKRELMFRHFAQAYGTTSLNGIMDLNFPTLNNLRILT